MANEFENIEKVVEKASSLYADSIRDAAMGERLFNSGQLAQSIKGETYNRQGKVGLQISMEDYGLYQDSGVNGIKQAVPRSSDSLYPPGQFRSTMIGGSDALTRWANSKGINEFALRKSIAEKGLKPRPFIVQGLTRVTQNFLVPNLEEAGVKDIEQYVELAVQGLDKVK